METPTPPFRLKTETAPTSHPRLQQVELFRGWSEFYPEELDPIPPPQKPPTKPWWQRNQYE